MCQYSQLNCWFDSWSAACYQQCSRCRCHTSNMALLLISLLSCGYANLEEINIFPIFHMHFRGMGNWVQHSFSHRLLHSVEEISLWFSTPSPFNRMLLHTSVANLPHSSLTTLITYSFCPRLTIVMSHCRACWIVRLSEYSRSSIQRCRSSYDWSASIRPCPIAEGPTPVCVTERITYKLCILVAYTTVFKVHGTVPRYLQDVIQPVTSRRRVRST